MLLLIKIKIFTVCFPVEAGRLDRDPEAITTVPKNDKHH